eukprot:TRINITY_DN11674_c0_g1_i1.p1 TRINITY_DN11674_c0_g1~~TRINITY_DN11674_c0_g1_i1.p1  ORF type:complete len:814 (+),score=213.96 TRINITY_DN11674_c0_g1_i1:109-2550(+)
MLSDSLENLLSATEPKEKSPLKNQKNKKKILSPTKQKRQRSYTGGVSYKSTPIPKKGSQAVTTDTLESNHEKMQTNETPPPRTILTHAQSYPAFIPPVIDSEHHMSTPTMDLHKTLIEQGNQNFAELNFSLGEEAISYEEIIYYFNLETVKRYLTVIKKTLAYKDFSNLIGLALGITVKEFVIFVVDEETGELRSLKRDDEIHPSDVYYVIETAEVTKVLRKLKLRLKKEKPIFNSVNCPLIVDFIDPKDLYLSGGGRLGLCMAPGRKKKKKRHLWERDLVMDLDRLKNTYATDVLVTLVREPEIRDLRIKSIFSELKARNIKSLFMPIKDKWIPKSMVRLIGLVEKILACLRQEETVVVHCNGGKGRSATVLVAVMIAMGRPVSDATKIIQRTRKGTLKNPLQQAYLRKFKKEWHHFQKIKRKKVIIQQSMHYSGDSTIKNNTPDDEARPDPPVLSEGSSAGPSSPNLGDLAQSSSGVSFDSPDKKAKDEKRKPGLSGSSERESSVDDALSGDEEKSAKSVLSHSGEKLEEISSSGGDETDNEESLVMLEKLVADVRSRIEEQTTDLDRKKLDLDASKLKYDVLKKRVKETKREIEKQVREEVKVREQKEREEERIMKSQLKEMRKMEKKEKKMEKKEKKVLKKMEKKKMKKSGDDLEGYLSDDVTTEVQASPITSPTMERKRKIPNISKSIHHIPKIGKRLDRSDHEKTRGTDKEKSLSKSAKETEKRTSSTEKSFVEKKVGDVVHPLVSPREKVDAEQSAEQHGGPDQQRTRSNSSTDAFYSALSEGVHSVVNETTASATTTTASTNTSC